MIEVFFPKGTKGFQATLWIWRRFGRTSALEWMLRDYYNSPQFAWAIRMAERIDA